MSVAAQQKVEIELRMKQLRWLSEVTPHKYTGMGEVDRAKVGAALHKAVAGQLKKVGPSREEVEDACGVRVLTALSLTFLCCVMVVRWACTCNACNHLVGRCRQGIGFALIVFAQETHGLQHECACQCEGGGW